MVEALLERVVVLLFLLEISADLARTLLTLLVLLHLGVLSALVWRLARGGLALCLRALRAKALEES
jgi:hypothetical protein